jgi:hypothetical protein
MFRRGLSYLVLFLIGAVLGTVSLEAAQALALALTAPVIGSTLSGTIALGASANAPGLKAIQFLADGRPIGAPITAGACALALDTKTLADGAHALQVRGTTDLDALVLSAPVSVTVKNTADAPPIVTPPTGQLPLPAGAQSLLTTQVPTEVNATDHRAYELGVRLVSDAPGTILALRYYKGSSETGAHVGHVWSASGQALATVTFTNETAGGWQEQALTTPQAIAAGAEFVVSVTTGDSDFFWVAADTYATVAGHLKLTPTPGRVGPVGSSPATLSATNYFRDLVFRPDGASVSTAAAVDLTPILSAIQLSTDKILSALKPTLPPVTVPCAVVTVGSYANGDQKVTCRIAAGGFAVGQILQVIK